MTPTCAICGERDAVTLTAWDERAVPGCDDCLAGVAEPESPRGSTDERDFAAPALAGNRPTRIGALVQAVKRHPGATRRELAAALGVPLHAHGKDGTADARRIVDRFGQALARAARQGLIRHERLQGEHGRYYPVRER